MFLLAIISCVPPESTPSTPSPRTAPATPPPILSPATPPIPPTPPRAPPNIVYVMIDDLGIMDLGSYGSDLYRTPSIDRLAAEGVRFTNAYASAPLCSPSRAAIVTGQFPARLHLTDWIPGRGNNPRAELLEPHWTPTLPDVPTIATVLKARGYATAWHGKWHLGNDAIDAGFDEGIQDWSYMSSNLPHDPKGVMAVTELAMSFMDTHRDQPFFVAISHYAVHVPLSVASPLSEEYEQIIEQRGHGMHNNARYAAMVEAVDSSVGVLMGWLAHEGLLENTVVIVGSDNGGEERVTDNGVYREGKATVYEGGIRIPLIIWDPTRFQPTTTDAVVTGEDMLPTFAALAGFEWSADGESFLPALMGDEIVDHPVHIHYPHNNPGGRHSFPAGALQLDGLKLIERFHEGESAFELYDLHSDPGETIDLASVEPSLTESMVMELQDWRSHVGAQDMIPR